MDPSAPPSASGRHRFKTGDIVWAKAFPFPYCPCRILNTKRSTVLLSPFGWDTTHWSPLSDILAFSKNYHMVVRLVGSHLRDEIGLAVQELERKRFDEKELLGFVLDKAVRAWVGEDGERMAGVVGEFRCYRSVKVDRFDECEEDVRFSNCSDGLEIAANGNDQKVSYTPSKSEMVLGVAKSQDFYIERAEEVGNVFQGPAPNGCFTCPVNSMDFSIFDSDEEYGSPSDSQPLSVVYGIGSPGTGRNGTFEAQNLCAGSSVQEKLLVTLAGSSETKLANTENEVTTTNEHEPVSSDGSLRRTTAHHKGHLLTDLASFRGIQSSPESHMESPCCERSFRAENNCQDVCHETELHPTERAVDTLENKIAIRDDEFTMTGQYEISDSSALLGFSADNLPSPTPRDGEQSLSNIVFYSNIYSPQDSHTWSTCCRIYPHTQDNCDNVDNGTEISKTVRFVESFEAKIVDQQDEATMMVETEMTQISDPSTPSVTSASSLQSSTQCEDGQLPEHLACDTHSSQESDMGTTCSINSSDADDCGNVALGSDLHVTEKHVDSIEVKVVNMKDEVTTNYEQQRTDSSTLLVSSADSLQRTRAIDVEQLLTGHSSHCDTHSPDEKLKNKCNPNVSLVDGALVGETYSANIVSGQSPQTTPASVSLDRKRRHNKTFTCDDSLELSKTTTPISAATPCTSSMIKFCSSRKSPHHETVADHAKGTVFSSNADNHVITSHLCEDHSIIPGRSKAKCDSIGRDPEDKKKKSKSSGTLRSQSSSGTPWKGLDQFLSRPSQWRKFYASPLAKDPPISTSKAQTALATDKSSHLPKSLHMKFPNGFKLPSKENLENKFSIFGPLDCSKTELFSSTGSGKVVFLKQTDAEAAYKHMKKRSVSHPMYVHCWFDEYEKYRKFRENRDAMRPSMEHSYLSHLSHSNELSMPIVAQTSSDLHSCTQKISRPVLRCSDSNLKSCLKRPGILLEQDLKKKRTVRFIMETF